MDVAEQERALGERLAELIESRSAELAERVRANASRVPGTALLPIACPTGWPPGRVPPCLAALIGMLRGGQDRQALREAALAAHRAGIAGLRLQRLAAVIAEAISDIIDAHAGADESLKQMARDAAMALAGLMASEQAKLVRAECGPRCLVEELIGAIGETIILAHASTGRIIQANRAAEQLTGFSASQLTWMHILDILPDATDKWRNLKALRPGEHAERFECSVKRRDGAVRHVAIAAGRIDYRGKPAVHFVLTDITAQRELVEKLRQEVREQLRHIEAQQRFYEKIMAALPIRLLVLDRDLRIVFANPAYYTPRGLTCEEVVGRSLDELFPKEILDDAGLRAAIESSFETGEPVRWSGFRSYTPDHRERVVNIRLDPCEGPDGQPYLVLSIEDVTERHRQLYERTLLQDIMRAMLEARDLDQLLHAILTGMTAGGAAGLGFNRAFLLLVDEDEGVLRGEMAVGPETPEEAYRIWSQLSRDHRTIEDFMADFDKLPPPDQRPLARIVRQMVFPLTDSEHLPVYALVRNETVRVSNASQDPRVPDKLRELLGVEEFVVAPLVVKEKPIGVALADNFVTQRPITENDMHLLTALANHAALAIDNARAHEEVRRRAEELQEAYQKLKQAQEELVRAKQLAAIGEVAEIVAHEIRNPLSVMGKLAAGILRKPTDIERVKKNAEVIRQEAMRLERILRELLEFRKPEAGPREPVAPAELIEKAAVFAQSEIEGKNIKLRVEVEPDLPRIMVNRDRMEQVLLNLIRNAVEAMPDGGVLTLRARREPGAVCLDVSDTGHGIPPERLEEIFDAFVTTKPTGTGLGLALSRAIVVGHGGDICVKSKPGEGSTFSVRFPKSTWADGCGAAAKAVGEASGGG